MYSNLQRYRLAIVESLGKLNNFSNKNCIRKISFCLILLASFVLIYIFNRLQPIFGDDWRYSLMDDGVTRIGTASDIFISLYHHYFEWGGRIVVHLIDEILLLVDKRTADIVNSLAYIAYTIIIYRIANISQTTRPSLLLGINLLIFFFQPAFASTILWITGSANYLWGTLIVLSFLYFYAKETFSPKQDKSIAKALLFFLAGILTGWTNENVAVALVFMLISFILYYKYTTKFIPTWAMAGLIGAVVGTIFMIAAPGNYARMGLIPISEHSSKIDLYLKQFVATLSGYYYYVLIPSFIYFFILFLYKVYGNGQHKQAVLFTSALFFVGAIVATLAMTASPIFPSRAAFGIISFVFVASGILFANLKLENKLINRLVCLSLAFGVLLFSTDYIRGYKTLEEVDTHLTERQNKIEEGKNNGITNFVLEDRIYSESRFLHYFELTPDSTDWHNRMFSGYNGIHSIVIK